MRKHLLAFVALLSLLSPAKAADSTLAALTAAGAVAGADLFYCTQAGADRKCTATQMATYINSLFSGDCTATSGGVLTCTKINGVTFPASGTSGGIPYFSATGTISSSAALTANLPVIGGGAGVAPSVGTRSGNTTAFVTTTGTQTSGNCVSIDANGNHIANGAGCATGTVTSVATACGLSGGPITTTGTISGGAAVRAATGTTDTILSTDCGKVVTESNAGAVAVTLPQATGSFAAPFYYTQVNLGVGTVTITPTTSTINGAATLALTTGQSADIVSDGTNYIAMVGKSSASGGTPGGSSGQVQYNNAGAFGGYTPSGDSTVNTSTGVYTNTGAHPGYVSGSWYGPFNASLFTGGSAAPANSIGCRLQIFPKLITINSLAVVVSTVGTTNTQIAIYANSASNRPSTLIGNTGNIVNTSTGGISGAMAANKQIGPGGADGGKYVWMCVNQNDSSVNYVTNNAAAFDFPAFSGDATLANIVSSASNDMPSGVHCSGANCQGGSSTFGSWPANLSTSTWTIARASSTGNYVPVVYFKAN